MGNWTVIVPEAATNRVLNSGFELDAIAAAAATNWSKTGVGETFLVDSTYAHNGIRSLKITPSGVSNRGATQAVTSNTSASTQYTLSAFVRGTGGFRLRVFDDTASDQYSSTFTLSSSWQRCTFTFTFGAGATRSIYVVNWDTAIYDFWVDDIQLEQAAYYTTYVDGDQPGCYFNGLAHNSTSTRDAQYRGGGRERDLETTYSVKVLAQQAIGMPSLQNNLQPMALQPGAIYQSYKTLPREITLLTSTEVNLASSIATLHQRRQSLINLFSPDAVRGEQAITLGYTGASTTRTVYGQYRYSGGIEMGALEGRNEKIGLRLTAVDPLWYEDTQEIQALDFQDALAADYAFARIRGVWQRFGTGFNGIVYSIAIDYQHNRVYFGGSFTTANGVTCNGIGYWDGTTFQPLGAATKGVTGGAVYSIAIAPNGDIWAGGVFTAAGGSATKGLATWAYPGTAGPTVYNTATTMTGIYIVAIDGNYNVYVGGTFTVFMGTANANHIAKSADRGSTWTALTATPPSGGTPYVNCMAIDTNGNALYFGGDFTAVGGVSNTVRVAKFDGTSTITALGSGLPNNSAYWLSVLPNGAAYIGGTFTGCLARWDGSVLLFYSISGGVIAECFDQVRNHLLYYDSSNYLRFFMPASGVTGSYDLTLSASDTRPTITVDRNTGDIYFGLSSSLSSTVSGITTVTTTSTCQTYPIITITGTTTAGATSTLNFIENQTTNQRLYFNLTILAGETITIDLRTGKKTVSSDWRGTIYNQPLSNSDFGNFRLQPGANTIACYLSGTTTGCTALIRWRPQHFSIDGVA